ncbi:hypothetical protein H0O01_02220 [Candidatus Micrarchaeota archaeon]|nr:hypothetical protein [Candidatus Micrarchaeota archaeon]
MEFGAASAIPDKYRQILADEELVGRLALRISMHSIDYDDGKAQAAEFRSFLTDLAHERRLGKLWEMRGRAGGNERKAAQAALYVGLDECGESGHLDGPVELLRKEGLAPKVRKAAEKAIFEAMLVCGRGGRVSLALELLDKEWLPEKVHVKALEVAGKGTYANYEKYMETVIGLFGKEWASPELRESAERALMEWAIDECLDRADPDDTGALLGLDENGMTTTKNVDKGKLVSLVLGLAANEQIATGVRVKAVDAATACQHVGRDKLADALGEVMEKEVPPELMEAVQRALEACGARKVAMECAGKTTEELVKMRAAIRTGERRFVDEAILERFGGWAAGGCTEELAEILEKKDLSPRLRAEGEKSLLEAVDLCGNGENADGLLKLLKTGRLAGTRAEWREKLHIKVIENLGRCQNVDCGKLVDALGDILCKKDTLKGLRKAAERALPGPVEECIREGGIYLGAAAGLFKKSGIPWGIINRVMEACVNNGQCTKIAQLFKRGDMPEGSAKIAERVLLQSIDFFAKASATEDPKEKAMIGYVVVLLEEKKLPESVYLKGIEVCRKYEKVHGYPFVDALGEFFSRPDVTQPVRDAAEKALLGGELLECAGAGHTERLEKLSRMQNIPERVKEQIDPIFEACRKLKKKQREEAANGLRPNTPVSLSGDQGFVDSRVRPPSSEKKAVAPAESAPVTRIVPANGRKPEN